MYTYKDITELHIELSSRCQASCPQCIRNIDGGVTNPLITETDIDLESYIKIVGPILPQLKHIIYCGNVGDPLMNKDFHKIVEYTRDNNPDIYVDIHTNGSLRNTEYWSDLVNLLPKNHTVYWGIDGLEDTHSIYRIGTDYHKILNNATAFNNNGGNSVWTFITFKHNEHQLEVCRDLSKQLGFKSFSEKQSSRFMDDVSLTVRDKHGYKTHTIEPASTAKLVYIKRSDLDNYKKLFKNVKVSCKANNDNSIYIDSRGILYPCCYLANAPISIMSNNYHIDNTRQLREIPLYNTHYNTIEAVTNGVNWQLWDKHITTLPMCARTCGDIDYSKPIDQFISLT